MKTVILAAVIAATATVLPAGTVLRDKIETIPDLGDGISAPTEVDRWSFTVRERAEVTVDVLSWHWDPDGDGLANHLDAEIFVMRDDGDLDVDDVIAYNDDSLETFDDGSVSALDSYLSLVLDPGKYILAIGEVETGPGNVVRGINEFGFYPEVIELETGFPEANGDGCDVFDCSFADYQLTFTGPITLDQPIVAHVPLPTSALLLVGGIGGLLVQRRRAKS
ncbi:DVUA0089 family protein [Actibacterium sp. 188UL27-1]|uniref:DVUA0089 family protein n=1 Tax=Actibacterium sp. 188UL27-1 TaxID=2786961 RepID=UPI00195A844A|nr:DVUA0089 family protein [Actibacterium sp. 188UL27-1]MBM7067633.1 DVUA0089 family protein [Actibacterium sp. 188UL27-1]